MPSERFRKKTIDRIKKKKEAKEEESERRGDAGTGAFGPKKKPSLLRRFLNKEAPSEGPGPVQTRTRRRLQARSVKRRENQEDAANIDQERAERRREEKILVHTRAGNTVEDAETAVETEEKTRGSLGISEEFMSRPEFGDDAAAARLKSSTDKIGPKSYKPIDQDKWERNRLRNTDPTTPDGRKNQEAVDQDDTMPDISPAQREAMRNASPTEQGPSNRNYQPMQGVSPGTTGLLTGGTRQPVFGEGGTPRDTTGQGLTDWWDRKEGDPQFQSRPTGQGQGEPTGGDPMRDITQRQTLAARAAEEQARLPQPAPAPGPVAPPNLEPQSARPDATRVGPPNLAQQSARPDAAMVGPPNLDPGARQALDDFMMNIEPSSLTPQLRQQLAALFQQLGR